MSDDRPHGLARGLTNYGDRDFSVHLRNSFAASMGYSRDAPKKPTVGSANMVLQPAGPESASGMPEAGYLPIPRKLSAMGVKDRIRLSDARMSGTAFGTIVLQVSPESAIGGPLGLVRTGDRIRLSVKNKSIALLVDDAELANRGGAWRSNVMAPQQRRGYDRLYASEVLQADKGCDFGFMRPVGAGKASAASETQTPAPEWLSGEQRVKRTGASGSER